MSQRAIRLMQAHTHAGMPYAAGALLFFDPLDADWLVEHDVGEPVGPEQLLPGDITDAAEPETLALSASTETDTENSGDDHE